MHVNDVDEPEGRYVVRRVFLPTRAVESFTEEARRLQRATVSDGRGRPAETWTPAPATRAA